jgi:hypothetical protein
MQWALNPPLDGLGLGLKDLRFDHLGLDLPHSVGSLAGSLQPGCEASIIIVSTETAKRDGGRENYAWKGSTQARSRSSSQLFFPSLQLASDHQRPAA